MSMVFSRKHHHNFSFSLIIFYKLISISLQLIWVIFIHSDKSGHIFHPDVCLVYTLQILDVLDSYTCQTNHVWKTLACFDSSNPTLIPFSIHPVIHPRFPEYGEIIIFRLSGHL